MSNRREIARDLNRVRNHTITMIQTLDKLQTDVDALQQALREVRQRVKLTCDLYYSVKLEYDKEQRK